MSGKCAQRARHRARSGRRLNVYLLTGEWARGREAMHKSGAPPPCNNVDPDEISCRRRAVLSSDLPRNIRLQLLALTLGCAGAVRTFNAPRLWAYR
jgi:hypothetical protein